MKLWTTFCMAMVVLVTLHLSSVSASDYGEDKGDSTSNYSSTRPDVDDDDDDGNDGNDNYEQEGPMSRGLPWGRPRRTTTTTRTQRPSSSTTSSSNSSRSNTTSSRKKTAPPDNRDILIQDQGSSRALMVGLGSSSSEEIVDTGDSVVLSDGSILSKSDHFINEYPVWNSGVTFVQRNSGVRGLMVVSSSRPSDRIAIKFNEGMAMSRSLPTTAASVSACKANFTRQLLGFTNVTVLCTRFVYSYGTNASDVNDVTLADKCNCTAVKRDGTFFRRHCLVDAKKAKVLKTWNGVMGTWDGGNRKTSKYTYGSTAGKPSFANAIKSVSGSSTQCTLQTKDSFIKVYHMNGAGGYMTGNETPYTFPCRTGPTDATTRAYGVLADSFYNAMKTVEMLRNSSYGGITSNSKISPKGVLDFAVHYQKNYDNAYWNGDALYFGDGGSDFYPLGTCLDVVAHEMGHAVTQAHSDLIYSDESGCLNEAFSDIMAELTEYYNSNETSNDFCIAKDCMATSLPCLRNMKDSASYNTYFGSYPSCGYDDCTDPHYCSAIVNYIFYKLATSRGWTTKSAGRAFMLANRFFWRQETTIKEAGCDVASAVKQDNIGGGDTQAVINAWSAAGVSISSCVTNPSSGNNGNVIRTTVAPAITTKAPGSSPDNAVVITNCGPSIEGISAATNQKKYYVAYAPYGSTKQSVQIYGNNGDADVYIKVGSAPTLDVADWAPYWEGSNEWVIGKITKSAVNYYIMINAAEAFSGLQVFACFS